MTDLEKGSAFAGATEWANHFDISIRGESVRAKAILSACYLDELLRHLLQLVLAPPESTEDSLLDGPQAPLGSFHAKIELCFRMRVIQENVKLSLHLVRRIRNEFAHRLSGCDFDDPKIRSLAGDLHRLNDHVEPEMRARFSSGVAGDFDASVSWLVFWLKHTIDSVSSNCPHCGEELAHRSAIKAATPS